MSAPELSTHAVDNGRPTNSAAQNGQPAPAGPGADASPPSGEIPVASEIPSSPTERAEEMVDWLAVAAAHLISVGGRWLLTAAAHTREATEDFWAEVQSIRREKR